MNKTKRSGQKFYLWNIIMSSDESGEDEGKEVIIAHSLPWLFPNLQLFKKRLDEASFKEKSPQAKRMIKERRVGNNSLRP